MPKHYAAPFVPVEPPVKEKPAHYVDNKRFYAELVTYREAYFKAKEAGEELPRVSNYLGDCIMKIANGLAQKHNFRGYSYVDLMISTAVETCLRSLHVFDPAKSTNPFSYYTQACNFAFIHVIQKEKRQADIRKKLIMQSAVETFDLQSMDEDSEFAMPLIEYLNSITDEKDSAPVQKPEKPQKPGGLEGLFDE